LFISVYSGPASTVTEDPDDWEDDDDSSEADDDGRIYKNPRNFPSPGNIPQISLKFDKLSKSIHRVSKRRGASHASRTKVSKEVQQS
jgi:hypothetical protein